MTDVLILTETDFRLLRMLKPHAELQRELERAIVVSPDAVPRDVVTMNSRVLYADETSGERRLVTVVYPGQADASEGKVSVLEPVGTALLGLCVGQAIDWDFPGGSTRRLRVEDVSDPTESSGHRDALASDAGRQPSARRKRGPRTAA